MKVLTRGFDIDKTKIKMINDAKTYIKHIPSSRIRKALNNGLISTTDFSHIKNVESRYNCVPTRIHNEPDLSYIKGTLIPLKAFTKELYYLSSKVQLIQEQQKKR